MNVVFYLTAGLAVLSTAMAITRIHAVHALLYLIVSFLAVAMIFLFLVHLCRDDAMQPEQGYAT